MEPAPWDNCRRLVHSEVGVKAVVMPAFGVAMSEGLLLQWLKATGDAVAAGEPIMEIETDKSTVEVESPANGILGPLLFQPGAVVGVGVEMARILEPGDDPADLTAELPAATARTEVVGPEPRPNRRASGDAETPLEAPAAPIVDASGSRASSRPSPRERRLAREAELARSVQGEAGSGPGPAEADAGVAAAPGTSGIGASGRHRERIAGKVSESWRTIPHFAVTREVDASSMLDLRERWGERSDRPSLTDLMLRALALALNEAGEPGAVDVGLAVATPHGVAIPVIRGVLALDLGRLRYERETAVARARNGHLLPADLTEAPRSTLSNLGPQGIDSFTGVIALGQMSLLTVGRVMPRPYVAAGGVSVRDTFFATLNVDHRHLDGDDAARLLMAFVAAAEDAVRLERKVVLA